MKKKKLHYIASERLNLYNIFLQGQIYKKKIKYIFLDCKKNIL
jgi:hypothetical protein